MIYDVNVIQYRLIYSDQLAPAAKVDVDGNVIEQYVYGEISHVPGYIIKNGTTYRVISDHLGSVRKVVDSVTGTVAQEISYDEFGNVLSDSNPGFQPFYYVGGVYDLDTGLTKFGARDYDPETGRWTSKEPLGFEGSLNFYSYCDADPVNYVDVTGLKLVFADDADATDRAFITAGLAKLEKYSSTAKELIFHLEISEIEVIIRMANTNDNDRYNDASAFDRINKKNIVTWQPNTKITEPWEVGTPAEIGLAHELIHALHTIHRTRKPFYEVERFRTYPEEYFTVGLVAQTKKGATCSQYPFTENRIRKDYMKYFPNMIFRNYYYTGAIGVEKSDLNPAVCY